jgi:hypothetical protein
MTADERDREAGRVRREYQENNQELAALKSKVRRLGERLQLIGKVLVSEPENCTFHREWHDTRFKPKLDPPVSEAELAEVQNLPQLTNQIREAIVKARELREEVMRHEGKDPEL